VDERKARQNIAKHGVPFDYATRFFWTCTGWTPRIPVAIMAKNGGSLSARLKAALCGRLHVRGQVIRLISARKANEREWRKYVETLST